MRHALFLACPTQAEAVALGACQGMNRFLYREYQPRYSTTSK